MRSLCCCQATPNTSAAGSRRSYHGVCPPQRCHDPRGDSRNHPGHESGHDRNSQGGYGRPSGHKARIRLEPAADVSKYQLTDTTIKTFCSIVPSALEAAERLKVLHPIRYMPPHGEFFNLQDKQRVPLPDEICREICRTCFKTKHTAGHEQCDRPCPLCGNSHQGLVSFSLCISHHSLTGRTALSADLPAPTLLGGKGHTGIALATTIVALERHDPAGRHRANPAGIIGRHHGTVIEATIVAGVVGTQGHGHDLVQPSDFPPLGMRVLRRASLEGNPPVNREHRGRSRHPSTALATVIHTHLPLQHVIRSRLQANLQVAIKTQAAASEGNETAEGFLRYLSSGMPARTSILPRLISVWHRLVSDPQTWRV